MARTVNTSIDENVDSLAEKEIRQVVRWISKTNVSNAGAGFDSVEDVNKHLSNMLAEGFKLFNTHYLGENPESFGVLYVLVRE